MKNLIKYELYKLICDKFFWVITGIILLINFVMFAGQSVTLEKIVQKLFLTAILATLYGCIFIGRDFDEKVITYSMFSGNSRYKILLSKVIIVTIAMEVQLFTFPVYILITQNSSFGGEVRLIHGMIIALMFLGLAFGSLAAFVTVIVKNSGLSAGITITVHLVSLLCMNNRNYGELVMHFFPIGILHLMVKSSISLLYCISVIVLWISLTLGASIYVFSHSNL